MNINRVVRIGFFGGLYGHEFRSTWIWFVTKKMKLVESDLKINKRMSTGQVVFYWFGLLTHKLRLIEVVN